MTDAPKKTHYELSTGAVALLRAVLPGNQWYKDDPKAGLLLSRSVDAYEALPKLAQRPKPEKDETQDAFDERVEAWAEPVLEFEWTDKQKDAVKKCITFYLKQGFFGATKHTVAVLRLLGLDDE